MTAIDPPYFIAPNEAGTITRHYRVTLTGQNFDLWPEQIIGYVNARDITGELTVDTHAVFSVIERTDTKIELQYGNELSFQAEPFYRVLCLATPIDSPRQQIFRAPDPV